MTLVVWRLVSTSLLLACLASFGWGMREFFSRPAGTTAGMKAIKICGVIFAALHLGALVWTPKLTTGQLLTAAGLYLCALALFWWAIRTNLARRLSASFSSDTPQHLVERGPYRWMRHPFYCSYLLAWTAGMVATAQVWLLPSVAVMLVIYLRAAREEEQRFIGSPLAGSYRRYQSRTGQFLPNPVKLFMTRRSS